LWVNFLKFRLPLSRIVSGFVFDDLPNTDQLSGNLYYACAMARVQYYRAPEALPAVGDVAGQAALYLLRYNAGGAATTAEFMAAWHRVQALL